MPQYIAPRPRRASDENWVLTIVSITVVAVLCMFALGYFLSRQWSQEASTQREQAQQIETYRRATAPPSTSAAPSAQSIALQQAQHTRSRLLAHPSVTPAQGFDRPGVQSTGAAIVDAIDKVQLQGAR